MHYPLSNSPSLCCSANTNFSVFSITYCSRSVARNLRSIWNSWVRVQDAGVAARLPCELQQLGHAESTSCPKPRKLFSSYNGKGYHSQQLCSLSSTKRNSQFRYAYGKEAEDSFFSDVREDTDEMYDELFNKHGKVVFSRKDKKPATAEVDDDAESLS